MSKDSTNGISNGHSPHEYTVPLQINGKEVQTNIKYDVVSPETGKVIWQSSSADKADAIKAVEAAHAAFPSWSKTKPATRRDIFIKAADIFAASADEYAEIMMNETGATSVTAAGFNVPSSIEMLRDVGGRIATVTGYVPVAAEQGKSAIVYKEPYGVVLGIAPWNAPYILGFRAVIYAIAGGNTTILKGSELSPRCFEVIGSVFTKAGLPDGVLNVISCRPQDAAEVTTALIEHAAVKKINFTGSTAVGSIIAAQAGKNLKPVLMELGGKAPAIILKDADIKKAAHWCTLGAFSNTGQICMSTEKIIVHSSLASSFSTAFKESISQIFNPEEPCPVLITPAGGTKNKTLINEALSKGAKILTGDLDSQDFAGTRMRPIVVEGVTKEMDLFYQESFGNSVSLITFESEEEAIEMANDTEYGLSASVFTEDLAAGLRVARQIESGAVHVNNMTVHDEANLPHGGVGKSGFGRFNGTAGIEEFLKMKTVTWTD